MTMDIAVRTDNARYNGGLALRIRLRNFKGGGREFQKQALMRLGEPQPASNVRSLNEWRARYGERYRIGDGHGLYLTRDGQGVTTCSREAWFGTAEQLAAALARFPLAADFKGLRVIDSKIPHRSTLRHLGGSE